MTTPPPSVSQLPARLQRVASTLEAHFLGKSETIRLMLVAAVAGEHVLLVGPPGTAKSALVRMFSQLVDARYFEYLLTRFTEPNELFGPIDIAAFRDGTYRRRTTGMLPEAEILFLDEIFKANSAILNSLLGVLNERQLTSGAQVTRVPLLSAFAASNEVPNDDDLLAVFDRFLLRIRSENLDSYHFQELLLRGVKNEALAISREGRGPEPIVAAADLHAVQRSFAPRLAFDESFLAQYKALVFQIRNEGVSISDRRAVKMLKLFAASAFVDGRAQPDARDFFVLRHVWNNFEQSDILDGIVAPVLEAHAKANPDTRRIGALDVGVDALVAELNRIRDVLTSSAPMSDVQLFSHLKTLNELKAALQTIGTTAALDANRRVDELLGFVYQTGKFA